MPIYRTRLAIASTIGLILCLLAMVHYRLQPQFFNLPSNLTPTDKVVLLVCMSRISGGMERCVLAQHKLLLQQGVNSILITSDNGYIGQQAQDQKLPVCLCWGAGVSTGSRALFPSVTRTVKHVIERYGRHVIAIHCNKGREVFSLHALASKHHLPIFFSKHNSGETHKALRQKADCVIGVSNLVKTTIERHNVQDGIKGRVVALPPLFETQKFLNFSPTTTRESFFVEKFGIALKPVPLISMIAHFAPDKNHPLLFHAVHNLIYKRNRPVQVVLAGSSEKNILAKYNRMINDLGLNDYISMTGATEQTPELLYYADFNVLPSLLEPFGIAITEGGLMKKPTITATGLGATDWLIIDNETGFIFENNDAVSLTNTIEKVLDNPKLAAHCGQALYEKVMHEFHPEKTIQNLIALYEEVHAKKQAKSRM